MWVKSQSFCAMPLQNGETCAEQEPLSRPIDQKDEQRNRVAIGQRVVHDDLCVVQGKGLARRIVDADHRA